MYGYKVLVSGILTAERENANDALIWTFVTGRAVAAGVMVKVLSVRSCVRTQFWHGNDMSETVAVILRRLLTRLGRCFVHRNV